MRFPQEGKIQPLAGCHQAVPGRGGRALPAPKGWDTCWVFGSRSAHLWKDSLGNKHPCINFATQ